MNMKKILCILVALGFVFAPLAAQQDTIVTDSVNASTRQVMSPSAHDITKAAADSAYMHNKYLDAIAMYEDLLKTGEAPELYYNLGNSYYKADDIARAILNYERALLLAPGNTDIRANLEIARAKTVDKVMPVPQIFFVAWTKSLINRLGVDAWARIGVGSFLLLLLSAALYFFSKQLSWKKIGFAGSLLFLVITILSNVFAYRQKSELLHRNDAIVLAPAVTVRSTPSESGTALFVLHEGRKVTVKDSTLREWREIQLEDGKVGWVPLSTIEVI
jgi:tetratricopeptide (TPR) repeat protein